MMRIATAAHLNLPVLGCVAAGVARFRNDLGDRAEGIVGPSQWEPELELHPELGPSPRDFARRLGGLVGECDYPAAQIYAAGLVTAAAINAADSLAHERIRAALADLRTTTLYGDFALDRVSGAQIGHKMLLVQWHAGHKVLIHPHFAEEGAHLELPSAWHLLFPGTAFAKLRRPRSGERN
jgi:branched-chain amino acid transport system substrate-binding protein